MGKSQRLIQLSIPIEPQSTEYTLQHRQITI